jgi:hypothetical protein
MGILSLEARAAQSHDREPLRAKSEAAHAMFLTACREDDRLAPERGKPTQGLSLTPSVRTLRTPG